MVHRVLGTGMASSTTPDPQARGLRKCLRNRVVEVPIRLSGAPSP